MKTFVIIGGSIIVAGYLALMIPTVYFRWWAVDELKKKVERDGVETLKRDPKQVIVETFERQDEIQKAMDKLFNL